MKNQPIILYASDEAAHEATVTGWVARDGRFWGDDEHMARWCGCTHIICECGQPVEKAWTLCDACRDKKRTKRWEAMPLVEWDGESAFCVFDTDRFFFDLDSFLDWMADEDEPPTDVRLELCEPVALRSVDTDYWSDDMHEDWEGDLPEPVQAALDALNAAIRAHDKPVCWRPCGKRIAPPKETPA